MTDWLILFTVVLAAALLQASTGYGFSIIGTPFLLLLYPAHTAIQVNIILSLCLSAFMIFKVGREVDRPLLGRLIAGSVIGLIPGIFVYLYLDVRWLKLMVGVLILLLTALLLARWTLRQTKQRDIGSGSVSGLLTTSIGVPGPPLLLYFSGVGTGRAVLRSTTLAFYLFIYFVSLVMQITFGGTSREAWLSALIALPALLLGILLGQLLFRRMSQRIFKVITYLILFFTGLYLLITSLG